ncbi:hypothetical protein J7E87_01295 [Streptomyces sp. ISL-1]|uniref:transposase family protein n=1 Tax=Streptomyces sp. ISL-1 TaxID=2817657 RepID=UPI001BEC9CCE|nr:hypothetical protein [Streptomyces sp. ISL-1]
MRAAVPTRTSCWRSRGGAGGLAPAVGCHPLSLGSTGPAHEGIEVLAPLAPTLPEAIAASGAERRLLLDGTLIPTWRCAGLATQASPNPLYSGKHHDHGANVQALTTTSGELLFLGAAHPGSTHDLTAARADEPPRSGFPFRRVEAPSPVLGRSLVAASAGHRFCGKHSGAGVQQSVIKPAGAGVWAGRAGPQLNTMHPVTDYPDISHLEQAADDVVVLAKPARCNR